MRVVRVLYGVNVLTISYTSCGGSELVRHTVFRCFIHSWTEQSLCAWMLGYFLACQRSVIKLSETILNMLI